MRGAGNRIFFASRACSALHQTVGYCSGLAVGTACMLIGAALLPL
jgi:hypothetical protein